jgi:hypothetical protein
MLGWITPDQRKWTAGCYHCEGVQPPADPLIIFAIALGVARSD